MRIIANFILVISLGGCGLVSENTNISLSKKYIESKLLDPSSVQYKNEKIVKSFDNFTFMVNFDLITKRLMKMYPYLTESEVREKLARVVNQTDIDKKNSEFKGLLKQSSVGVCIDFNAKNKMGGYAGFEKTLCIVYDNKDATCFTGLSEESEYVIDFSKIC